MKWNNWSNWRAWFVHDPRKCSCVLLTSIIINIKAQSISILYPDVHEASLKEANKHADLWMLMCLCLLLFLLWDQKMNALTIPVNKERRKTQTNIWRFMINVKWTYKKSKKAQNKACFAPCLVIWLCYVCVMSLWIRLKNRKTNSVPLTSSHSVCMFIEQYGTYTDQCYDILSLCHSHSLSVYWNAELYM